nr:retrovirus-related Pol polyprotein from transposon TNT 1-94 [Tanacetum cinerariifolium]
HIRVKEAYKITWSEFKRLLIKKYGPHTEIKKMEEAITMTQKLIEQVMKHNSIQETNNHKRKLEDRRNTTNDNNNNYHNNNRRNDHHQQQNMKQETFKTYTSTNGFQGSSTDVCNMTISSMAFMVLMIVQLILFIVDSGCTKYMTGNLKLLCNFVEKFLDLEVAFRMSTCFVRDLQGNDLLTGNHGSDLYTLSLQESTSSTPLYLMAKATPTQAWLWHRRLSHLNFDYINLLSKKDIVIGLPKLKYVKDQLFGSESRPPMLNKENYVPWSSRLLCYAKSRPNGKLIHNSIINGPYVRRMIPEQIEADDQAIQTILLGLPEDIYIAVDSCETA